MQLEDMIVTPVSGRFVNTLEQEIARLTVTLDLRRFVLDREETLVD
jgi:hypothetical protein